MKPLPLPPIRQFRGDFAELSNFAITPFMFDGHVCKSGEHGYQALKTLSPLWKAQILHAASPGKAKRLGRQAPLRSDWEDVKLQCMREIIAAKFTQNAAAGFVLYITGDRELIEGNTWGDTYWGVCRGVGENWLGRLLLEFRSSPRFQNMWNLLGGN